MANPLDPVMHWYRTTRDSLRLTERVINQRIPGAVTRRSLFYNQPVADCLQWLDSAQEEMERMVVLALTAIFERTLRDYLIQIPQGALASGDAHRDAVRAEIVKDIEFWNISTRVLEVFPSVDPHVRGQVKQIIDYRNWVAHGHTLAKPAPSNVLPTKAHQELSEFLAQAGVITP